MTEAAKPIRDNPLARQIIEAAPTSALVVDANGAITFANQKAETLFGYPLGELMGKPIEILVSRSKREAHRQHRAKFMTSPSARSMPYERDLYACHKDGTEFPVDISLQPINLEVGQVILAFVSDASERRRGDFHRDVIQSTRLAAVAELVSGLAHESRNALQRARACVDLIELDADEGSEQAKLADRIRRALVDLQQNYEAVKEYAAPIHLEFRKANLFDLCEEAFADVLSDTADRTPKPSCHRLRFAGRRDDAEAKVDKQRIKQLFYHVLENSIAAAPNGVEIVTLADPTQFNGDPAVLIELRDNGSGLACEDASQLFEPFFTTKQHGIGLGLAICRRIAEAHDGRISARTQLGGGATVDLIVPRRLP